MSAVTEQDRTPVFERELFIGNDEDEAVGIANDVEFGLSGAVYSSDQNRALEVARKIRNGTVNLNNGITMDIGVPFGGVKQSGYGRELGPEGLEAFLETVRSSSTASRFVPWINGHMIRLTAADNLRGLAKP